MTQPLKNIDMKRINHTFLGSLERRILLFLAERTPKWISPNIMTLIGFLGAVIIFFGYWLSSFDKNYLWLACFGWICNWYGDSLDGTLARYRKIEKPQFGFYIDHINDAIGELIMAIGFGLSPYVRFDVAMSLVIVYFLLSIQSYIYACSTSVFRISYSRMGATEFRTCAILITIALYLFKFHKITLFHFNMSVLDLLILAMSGIMTVLLIVAVMTHSIQLYRSDNHR